MSLLPSWLREDGAYIVDNADVIQMACWATGDYKDDWYSDQVPDVVWDLHSAGLTGEVMQLIEQGATWDHVVEALRDRL